jgi:hypothetical protein
MYCQLKPYLLYAYLCTAHQFHSTTGDVLCLCFVSVSCTISLHSNHSLTNCLSLTLRHCPHARKGNPTFRLTYFQNDGITYYILFSTAPRPQEDFWFSYFRPPIRVKIWRVAVATAIQRLPSFFLFSRILLSSSY